MIKETIVTKAGIASSTKLKKDTGLLQVRRTFVSVRQLRGRKQKQYAHMVNEVSVLPTNRRTCWSHNELEVVHTALSFALCIILNREMIYVVYFHKRYFY